MYMCTSRVLVLHVVILNDPLWRKLLRGGQFDNWGGGVEENVPEHFIYFFQEQRNFFYLNRSEKQFIIFLQ